MWQVVRRLIWDVGDCDQLIVTENAIKISTLWSELMREAKTTCGSSLVYVMQSKNSSTVIRLAVKASKYSFKCDKNFSTNFRLDIK